MDICFYRENSEWKELCRSRVFAHECFSNSQSKSYRVFISSRQSENHVNSRIIQDAFNVKTHTLVAIRLYIYIYIREEKLLRL